MLYVVRWQNGDIILTTYSDSSLPTDDVVFRSINDIIAYSMCSHMDAICRIINAMSEKREEIKKELETVVYYEKLFNSACKIKKLISEDAK